MKNHAELLFFATAFATITGCTDPADPILDEDPDDLAVCQATPPINIDRSLFVSPTAPIEQAQLRARFSVSRIMNHLLASAGTARPADGTELFQRWWDTQNKKDVNHKFPDNPHCDDNGQTINGFPVACPRNEGALANALPDSHFAVALIYRPDLAPVDGSTCGEARVVIAKPGGPLDRNLPIFEASIPNPDPGCGMAGCRKIAQFWANLSLVNNFSQRLDALERFYFVGLNVAQDGVATAPVLNASNLGMPDSTGARRGQIRTNQFMPGPFGQLWQLREFKLARECTSTTPGCKLFFEPVSDKTNPWGALFNDSDPNPVGPAFRGEFLNQLGSLSSPDLNAIAMTVTGTFNAGQSNSQGNENLYGFHLNRGNPIGFKQAINARLASLGIALNADNIAARATTQSCGGCHQLSNNAPIGGLDPQGLPLRWPASAGFVHVTEAGVRSPALNAVFLPKRKQILEKFLLDTCAGLCPLPGAPVPVPLLAPDLGPESVETLAGRPMVH
jgi:hypothetical protein